MTSRFLIVEIRIGTKDEIPSVMDWTAYKHLRDKIGRLSSGVLAGNAEVGQILELTNVGVKPRFRLLPQLVPPVPPEGPAAYCERCANSGVGVCDAYPNCPAGRRD